MVREMIGNRPTDITKDGDQIRLVFHPIGKDVKHPNATAFSIKLSKKDVELLRKAF